MEENIIADSMMGREAEEGNLISEKRKKLCSCNQFFRMEKWFGSRCQHIQVTDRNTETGERSKKSDVHRLCSDDAACSLLHPGDDHLFETFRSEEHTSELQSRGHLVC